MNRLAVTELISHASALWEHTGIPLSTELEADEALKNRLLSLRVHGLAYLLEIQDFARAVALGPELLCRRVTNATGARVVSVDYGLAPEHPYPAGLDDAEEVLHWLRTGDPGRPLGVAGDSAGASLAAGLALRARDKQIPLAAHLMLYPATDPAMTSLSFAENGEGYFLTRRDMAWFYQQDLPAGPASAPEADLAHADVAGVAPAIVATAEFDPLRDEGASYAARLADAGVSAQYVPGPGLIHGFAAFLGVVDAADAAVAAILDRLTRALHT